MCPFLSMPICRVVVPIERISIPEQVAKLFWRRRTVFDWLLISYPADVAEADQTKVTKDDSRRVGLCFDCLHAQRIQSDRGSTFFRCKLWESDANFPKYPRLPVLRCAGYCRNA
jgi:hypothetical protein